MLDRDQSSSTRLSPGIVATVLFVYGAIVCACGVVLAGGGHGSYFLLFLAGSPFSILGIPAAIFASFAQWGLLILIVRSLSARRLIIGLYLIVHYITAVYLLLFSSRWSSEWRGPQSHTLLAVGISFYLIGQASLWRIVRKRLP